MTRTRMTLGALFACAVTAITAACGGGSTVDVTEEKNDKLVIASWGGSFTESTKKAIAGPFGEAEGVDVTMIDAPLQQLPQLEAQQKSGKVTWDVIDSLDAATVNIMIQEGMLEKLPADLKQELEAKSGEGMVTDYGIMQTSISLNMTCNSEAAEKCPSTPREFFDDEAFPGPRVLYDDPLNMLYFTWAALGEIPEEPTDADVDRAFALLEEVKPSVRVYWHSGDESEQVFRNGDVVMGLIGNGRIPILMSEGIKLVSSWEGAVYNPSYNIVPKGAPNKETAFNYLRYYANHPEAQAEFANLRGNGVASPEAQKHMDKTILEWLPENPAHVDKLVHMNNEWWAENRDKISKRWRNFTSS